MDSAFGMVMEFRWTFVALLIISNFQRDTRVSLVYWLMLSPRSLLVEFRWI
jgi:hypothetical protein